MNKWKKRTYDQENEKELLKQTNKLVARLLSQRNIKEATKFTSANYNDLTHPHSLKGIKEAADLFCNTVKNKGKIAVLGDFDADGIISTTLIKELCNVFEVDCNVFIPSRLEHGYGLNSKSIETIKEKFNPKPDLLFIVDCGTSNEQEIKQIHEWSANTKIIIIDHHEVNYDNLSKSADILINWHLDNSEETCAGGEVFQFIRAIRWLTKKVDPVEFLSLSAISILADVSPIIGNNRIIVKNGLKEYALKHVTSSGLNALLKSAGLSGESLTQEDVSFKIAPRINAVGRLMQAEIVHHLLIEQNPTVSESMALKLNEHNEERKRIQKKITKEAESMVQENIDSYPHGILIYNEKWQIGLVGLIAAKLSEMFNKPTLVFGGNNNIIKGSGRSINNINLKKILDSCSDLFDNYGGHSMAVGATLKASRIKDANEVFNRICKEQGVDCKQNDRFYDVDIGVENVNMKTAEMLLNTIYPYCSKLNPEPIFKLSNVIISGCSFVEKPTWKMLSFYASKNDKKTELQFRMFNNIYGSEINGFAVDIYFSFPQNVKKTKYGYASANVIDIVKI